MPRRLLFLCALCAIGLSIPAFADGVSVYKGQLTDTSAGNTYCLFAGDITIKVAHGVILGIPAHAHVFKTQLEGNHFHVVIDRGTGVAPLIYDGDVSGNAITGTYRLIAASAQVHRGGPRYCQGDITATLQVPEVAKAP